VLLHFEPEASIYGNAWGIKLPPKRAPLNPRILPPTLVDRGMAMRPESEGPVPSYRRLSHTFGS
jgi:hypothetical protein